MHIFEIVSKFSHYILTTVLVMLKFYSIYRDQILLAITLAFNDKYMKLPSNWKRTDDNADIINFDGCKNVCSEDGLQHEQSGYGSTWQRYLNQKSGAILNA